MVRYFIDRPIFSWVIAIIIMLTGGLAAMKLPIAQYPDIAPPTVTISASYPGASAQVVEDSVTQIIEQNLSGLDGMLYISSTSQSTGSASIAITFESGTDPDIAQMQVQNKIQSAIRTLPQDVQNQGVSVSKSGTGFLMVLGFYSEDESMDKDDISDYINSNLVDQISRVEGVGSAQVFGAKYALRVWLDPHLMEHYNVTSSDIISAIKTQNSQASFGQLGQSPSIDGQEINATITGKGRLTSVEEFNEIIIRGNKDGATLKLKDIARVELGAENYSTLTRFNGKAASGVGISLSTSANALATADAVKELISKYEPSFPDGLKSVIAFDTTPFIKVSIKGVVMTLIEAIVLVFLVMLLFLQNIRATIIPTLAVPVVLLGTFGILSVLGFSINMLTMFAMVLAIGLLVDDAIVVVENVERIMEEEGLSPLEATRKSMTQITGALVGIGIVLSAVFVPMAFMPGSIGIIYQQFSATIVSAMGLSVLVAMIFTPALCATMLKPAKKGEHEKKGFFGWFNRQFDSGSDKYQRGVKGIVHRRKRFMIIFVVILGAMAYLMVRTPSGFLPQEDQGMLMSMIKTPVGSTQERTLDSLKVVEDHFLIDEKENVESIFGIVGFSFSGSGQNSGMAFIRLKDWDERTGKGQDAQSIAGRAMGKLMQINDAIAFAFAPPAMPSLGVASGFTFFLKDDGGIGRDKLSKFSNDFLSKASESSILHNVRINGMDDSPELKINIDTEKATALGLSIDEVNRTLSAAWGGSYIDDFIDRGRVKRVYVQADAQYRMVPDDFLLWTVKNNKGDMVPFSAFASFEWDQQSPRLVRYNGNSALSFEGEPAVGFSSGEAMNEVEKIVSELGVGVGMEWSGLSYQERESGNQTTLLYTLSFIIVFLCLAALYESWSVPTAVLLVAPLGIIGTLAATYFSGMERDIYFQVAMLTTIGLTSKNAILIVEFAKANMEQKGENVFDAVMHAVKDRLRPIVMTSLAFGLGVMPLALASGAGSGAQNAIGTGVIGGMLTGTFLGLVFIPLFFVVINLIFSSKKKENIKND